MRFLTFDEVSKLKPVTRRRYAGRLSLGFQRMTLSPNKRFQPTPAKIAGPAEAER